MLMNSDIMLIDKGLLGFWLKAANLQMLKK